MKSHHHQHQLRFHHHHHHRFWPISKHTQTKVCTPSYVCGLCCLLPQFYCTFFPFAKQCTVHRGVYGRRKKTHLLFIKLSMAISRDVHRLCNPSTHHSNSLDGFFFHTFHFHCSNISQFKCIFNKLPSVLSAVGGI